MLNIYLLNMWVLVYCSNSVLKEPFGRYDKIDQKSKYISVENKGSYHRRRDSVIE